MSTQQVIVPSAGMKRLPEHGGADLGSVKAGDAFMPVDSGWVYGTVSGVTGWLPAASVGPTPNPPPPAPGSVLDYPRLAKLYNFDHASQAASHARYGLVVGTRSDAQAVAALKSANPVTLVLGYWDLSNLPYSDFMGMTIAPCWWLTLAGTTLAGAISATQTTISVVNAAPIGKHWGATPHLLVDDETMVVTAISGNTLSVQRGFKSQAAAHGSGARAALHASNWSGDWMLNATQFCPVDPATHLTWNDYLISQIAAAFPSVGLDGVYLDDGNHDFGYIDGGDIDANNDNIADGSYGSQANVGTWWQDGTQALIDALRPALPGKTVLINGFVGWTDVDGITLESFPDYQNGLSTGLASYLHLAGATGAARQSVLNPHPSGLGSLQSMRFGLGLALLGDGFYAYDGGPPDHGQTWWYDEYDGGAGSCLTAALDATQTTLTVAAGTGARFAVGDTAHIPNDTQVYDDEQVTITAVRGDTLTVERGANGTQAMSHAASQKVFTQAQLAAGLGWLGQPQGDPTNLGTMQYSRQFANGLVYVNGDGAAHTYAVPAGYRHIQGTQDPRLNTGAAASSVTLAATDAVLLVCG